MAVLRPHLALTVSSVEGSVPFYEALFGIPPRRSGPVTRSSRSPSPR